MSLGSPMRGRTLRELVLDQISSDLVQGRLKPGDPLDQGEIAARLGVSRTPVREALVLLEAQGVVEAEPRRGQVIRANSLARANMTQAMGTPLADGYLERFRQAFGRPAHGLLLFDLARGIELVYALERALEIMAGPLSGEDTAIPYTPRDGDGYGMVEAPRGPLIHHYRIENQKIVQAEFVIPTVHNMLAIERALRVVAARYITGESINMELERAVGRVVRAFDPCIACATH